MTKPEKKQQILVDKELLEKTVNTLRDIYMFIIQVSSADIAKCILDDILPVKNALQNILIINPNTEKETALKLIDEMLDLETTILSEDMMLNYEDARRLRLRSDVLKSRLLNLMAQD